MKELLDGSRPVSENSNFQKMEMLSKPKHADLTGIKLKLKMMKVGSVSKKDSDALLSRTSLTGYKLEILPVTMSTRNSYQAKAFNTYHYS